MTDLLQERCRIIAVVSCNLEPVPRPAGRHPLLGNRRDPSWHSQESVLNKMALTVRANDDFWPWRGRQPGPAGGCGQLAIEAPFAEDAAVKADGGSRLPAT